MSALGVQFEGMGRHPIPEGLFKEVQPVSLSEMAGGDVKPVLDYEEGISDEGMRRRKFHPRQLVTTQTEYTPRGLKHHDNGPVVTAKLNGKTYLVDGHHRAIEAALENRKVDAMHFDVDKNPDSIWDAARYSQQGHK